MKYETRANNYNYKIQYSIKLFKNGFFFSPFGQMGLIQIYVVPYMPFHSV